MGLLDETIPKIQRADSAWRAKARERLEQLTMPYWALGRLMDLAEDLAGITRSLSPQVSRKVIVTMAGDHGVVEEGVSLYPQEVTAQMVHGFVVGGAGINALASVSNTRLLVADMGVKGDLEALKESGWIISHRIGNGTGNIAIGPAMDRESAEQCIEAGIEIALDLGDEADVFGTGDMGIGNTTASTAIGSVITGLPVPELAGRGTGIGDEQYQRKVAVIEKAIHVNRPERSDGIDVLQKVGGFEIGGIAGYILGAASLNRSILVDGFISTAGALIAKTICPAVADYLIASHMSAESGHGSMLNYLGKRPLLDLELRLGEGTGAALAMPLVDAASKILTEIHTFEEAGVSGKET